MVTWMPHSPDGNCVFYVGMGPPEKIWRLSVSGGAPVEIARVLGENVIGRLTNHIPRWKIPCLSL